MNNAKLNVKAPISTYKKNRILVYGYLDLLIYEAKKYDPMLIGVHKERKFQLSHMKDFYRNEMIKGNPTMISIKFKEGLEEIKSAVNKTRQKK